MASSSSSRTLKYDVFPSFSGEDVRRSFLSHLLKELNRRSIVTFIDHGIKRSSEIAPALLSAIRESRISIVVFSKTYVASTWCLNELAAIHECYKELGLMVIPVFYDVDPSHVRKQTGDFGETFGKTCEGKSEDDIKRWKEALREVANIAGEDSRNWSDEAKMIEQISNDVSNKLFTPSDDFRDFVGVGDHVDAIMDSMLCLESGGVRMVGIVGPSGIGKTTIARALFHRLSTQFPHRAFVTSKRRAMKDKEDDYSMKLGWAKQLLSKILGHKDIEMESLGMVEQRLKQWNVLIVLDDVHEIQLLKTLAGRTGWFGSGSRIIVVTQDRHLLKSHDIKLIYEVEFPSQDLALQMFCQSAFGETSPPNGFIWLAAEVVKLAGNLPLGLNVLGSYLRGRDKEYWVEMIRRNGLNGKIEKTLRLSYDGLDEKDDQEIFLYIACLFNGEGVNCIKNLLKNIFYNSVKTRLETLTEKSLVTTQQDTVQMHILLEKLGREIVCAESSNNPGKRRFLVDPKDISRVFNDNIGTKNVIGIHLDTSEIDKPLYIDEKAFKGMHNLQFIKFYKDRWKIGVGEVRLNLPRGLIYLSEELRLLHWDEYPAKYIPSSFSAEYLVELRMKNSRLEKLWEGAKPLQSLKKIDLSWSIYLEELPDLSNATNLEILDLSYCISLVTLPPSIRNLTKLINLCMRSCTKLEVFPTGVNLESLDYLDLRGCTRLRSFPRISKNISRLELDETAMEEEDCSWIGNLSGLIELDWKNCPLTCFPSNFHPEHLTKLLMGESKLDKLWEGVKSLTNLKHMHLSNSGSLKEIPDLSNAINLKKLNLSECKSLEEIPDLSKAINLEELDLSECKSLKEIPDLSKAINLEWLNFSGCENLKEIPHLSKAIILEWLDFSGCESLKEIPEFPQSNHLEEMILQNCTNLVKLPDSIQHLHKLTTLNMRGCTRLEVLPTNINLVSLTYLNLSGCSRLRTFPQLSTSIERLHLSYTAIEEVPSWIENIDDLTHLEMRRCDKLKTISANMWSLRLESVDFTDCGELTSVSYETGDEEIHFYSSLFDSKLLFRNCFNLDQDAQRSILQSDFRYAILPGKKGPTYFTHRARGNSLTLPLPHTSLSQIDLTFTAYIIPDFATDVPNYNEETIVHWKFRGVEGAHKVELDMVSAKMDHLLVFQFYIFFREIPTSQLDCENVELQFQSHYSSKIYGLTISLLPIKECGVRVLGVPPSLDASDRSSETDYTDQPEESDEESGRSKKQMQMTVTTSQEPSNSLCGQTAVNSGSMAPNLELSLGLVGDSPHVSSRSKVLSPSTSSRNFHGDGDGPSLNLSLSPFDPCLDEEASYVDPMITKQQDTSEDTWSSPQLINFFR